MAVVTYQPRDPEPDRVRYYRLRADKLERELKLETGELVSGAIMNKRLAKFLANVRQIILDSDTPAELQDDLIKEIGSLKKNFHSLPAL
jgi:hypothetical protein